MLRSILYDGDNQAAFADLGYHEVMLADRIRVDFYEAGLERAVEPGSTVVDLGTGTGILSLLAARRSPKRIYALEHSAIIEFARAAVAQNGADCVELVSTNSREFVADEPVDLIIHEQIGDFLFEENMLENLLDLKRRVLRPGGRIFPAEFDLHLEPVQLRPEYRVPFAWERPINGIDYSFAKAWPGRDETPRSTDVRRQVETGAAERYLCQREPILSIDLDQLTDVADVPRSFTVTREVTSAGQVDGISVYFRVRAGDLAFDTALDSPHTHWEQWVFRVPERAVEVGDSLELHFAADDLARVGSWAVSLA